MFEEGSAVAVFKSLEDFANTVYICLSDACLRLRICLNPLDVLRAVRRCMTFVKFLSATSSWKGRHVIPATSWLGRVLNKFLTNEPRTLAAASNVVWRRSSPMAQQTLVRILRSWTTRRDEKRRLQVIQP
jgi:hypothetical protein